MWSINKKSRPSGKTTAKVLYSKLAGQWYPGDAQELRGEIKKMAGSAPKIKIGGAVSACILPHAGYVYSGSTALGALKALSKSYSRVFVLGPSHRVSMPGKLSLPDATHYETPLGKTKLDLITIQNLLKNRIFIQNPDAHRDEHSVQIQIPLLQEILGEFELIPVVAGQLSLEDIQQAAGILRTFIDDKTLVIASSDFTHFGPRFGYMPFGPPIEANIKKLDRRAYERIEAADTRGFLDFCRSTGATICGRIPIAILMELVDKKHSLQLVRHTTSGDLTGDYDNSVSYISAVYTGHWKARTVSEHPAKLTPKDGAMLVKTAKMAIQYYLANQKRPSIQDLGIKPTPAMLQKRAAFVTLKKGKQLRGCIGEILPRVALIESVIHNAVNAAFEDPRFTPVDAEEFKACNLGISALTVPEDIDSYKKIRIGVDGIILRKSGHSAVFLPQVAPEQGWDVATTLNNLARKAGLPQNAWRTGAELRVFQAELFGKE